MRIVFFDLDKTLISKNSARLWLQHEMHRGHVTHWQALRALSWLLRYRMGDSQLDGAVRATIATLEGRVESELRKRMLDFYHSTLSHLYRPGAKQALRKHRQAGDHVALLTSSSSYIAHPVCQELQLDACICTQLEVTPQGRFTGRPVEPLCFGEGKLKLARKYALDFQIPLANCTFYTDSTVDLPLMQAVGHPVAVNPDPRLRRRARHWGWDIVNWGTPHGIS